MFLLQFRNDLNLPIVLQYKCYHFGTNLTCTVVRPTAYNNTISQRSKCLYRFVMSEQNRKVKFEEKKLLQKLDRQMAGSTMMGSTCGALQFFGPPSLGFG